MPLHRRSLKTKALTGAVDRFRAIVQYEIERRHSEKEIDQVKYLQLIRNTQEDHAVLRLMSEFERDQKHLQNGDKTYGWTWDDITNWLRDNDVWIRIIQILLTLLIFLEPKPEGEDNV
jgi:hypothetical protein